eukprot:1719368-Alexandrium_andersonii.AAC.1
MSGRSGRPTTKGENPLEPFATFASCSGVYRGLPPPRAIHTSEHIYGRLLNLLVKAKSRSKLQPEGP